MVYCRMFDFIGQLAVSVAKLSGGGGGGGGGGGEKQERDLLFLFPQQGLNPGWGGLQEEKNKSCG